MAQAKIKGKVHGEAHPKSILTIEQVATIYQSSEKPDALAMLYNTAITNIYRIKNQQTWRHITQHLERGAAYQRKGTREATNARQNAARGTVHRNTQEPRKSTEQSGGTNQTAVAGPEPKRDED